MFRALIHHWRMSLAVAAGAAVATAVLTGALLVGDSVRGSLRQLTLERLGGIDHALAGQRFFRQEVATLMAADEAFQARFGDLAPAILLQGGAQHAESRTRASRVGLAGVDDAFLALYGGGEAAAADDFFAGGAGIFPPVVINQALARALLAEAGDQILISLQRWSEVPRGSLLGRKDTESVVGVLRLEVTRVIPDRGIGRFALTAHQSSPFNAFVPLTALQKSLDQEGTVNSLLVAEKGDGEGPEGYDFEALLRRHLTPADLGLTVEAKAGEVSITSQEFVLKPDVAAAVDTLVTRAGGRVLPVLTYLANTIRAGGDDAREVPYSTVTATDVAAAQAFGGIRLLDGATAPALGDGDILLNAWTAEALEAGPGDSIELDFFQVTDREQLRETTAGFTVRGIVALEGLAADPGLVQDYPGIAGSDDMAEWDPPFPIDLGRIGGRDEDYWDRYRGTPKAFIATDVGKRLWRSRWGELTSMRLAPAAGGDPMALAEALAGGLVGSLPLDAFGLAFEPVKRLGLEASAGSSEYSGYFLGFSFFLIASAAMLVALLFGLGVEQRAAEVGLLRAVGYPARKVRRRLLAEGGTLAAIGALPGLGGAVVYAALMMAAARTWWRGAFGTSELHLFVTPLSLVLGFAISVTVVLFAVWRRVRRLGRVSTPALLKRVSAPPDTRAGRRARWTAAIALALATVLIAGAAITGQTRNAAIFGIAGPALLVGLLAAFALRLGNAGGGLRHPFALLRMAAASGARQRSRSISSATLVAAASFMIVTVAAFHETFSAEDLGRDSGTGGYALMAESDVPLLRDLASPEGRFDLGLPQEAEVALAEARIISLRLLPGDDTSCLNLYQPRQPRVLGAPHELIARGGFRFHNTIEEADNPWTLLERELEPGVIPAFGDINSTQYILKLKLGEDLAMENGRGQPIRLRLVGNLKTSIFQSELLISQAHFDAHFPDRQGASVFLVDTPAESTGDVTRLLEGSLGAYGFDVLPTAEKLADFHAVQNTFLSTFRTLGGLGLLLGTVGLAIVLLRNVIERQGELAALRAFGFKRSTLTWMVLVENGLLLFAGLAIGTVAALVTAGPHLLAEGADIPWRQIAGTLGGILLFGLAACATASIGALRIPLMGALKAEH